MTTTNEGTQRDELAVFLANHDTMSGNFVSQADVYSGRADAILAAGYRKLDLADESTIEKVADLLAYFRVQATNPAADHPRMGYYAFNADQRAHLRDRQLSNARAILTALHEPEAEATR